MGGLADVVTGICQALLLRGHDVEVHLPRYSCLDYKQVKNMKEAARFYAPKGTEWNGEMQITETEVSWPRCGGCWGVPGWVETYLDAACGLG